MKLLFTFLLCLVAFNKQKELAIHYKKFLIKEGYSHAWARKKAFVEYNILPVDSEYLSLESD